MNKAYKYRIYPIAEQEKQLTDTFGSCRFVYNHYLALQSENHQQVDKFTLTNAVYALDAGYQRFFWKKGGYPRFKSKHHSRMSYTTNFTGGNIAVLDGEVKLPKLEKSGQSFTGQRRKAGS